MTILESPDLRQRSKAPFAAHAGSAHVVADDRHGHSTVRRNHDGSDNPCLHVGARTADSSNEAEAISKEDGLLDGPVSWRQRRHAALGHA